jgi:RND family efflux transporter MFP subunit
MARISGRQAWALAAFGVIALGGLAATGAVTGSADGAAPEMAAERPAQPVRVSVIGFAATERVARYTGTIRPRHEVVLGFRVPGKVVARLVEVGDAVTRGQVVARLDDTDARLEMELAAAEAEAARVDRQRAEADAARSRTLFHEGHIAQAALDRAISGAAEAASRSERAERALTLAENRFGYAVLRADADGVVTAASVEPGQVVGAGQPVVSVAKTGALDVVFALPEQDRALLERVVARAELWGDEGRSYRLKLRDVAPDVDPAGRTYRVRMAIEDADAAASLGRTVTVMLDGGATAPVAAVPLAAVVDDGTGAAVWRVAGDRVERVAVEVASVTGEVAMIRGELAEGAVIVSLGAHKIDPARPVRVVETHAMPES